MAVVKAPVRQQSYLTEYDKLLAEQLRQISGSIGPGDIAAESYGGKFPVGTMTAKILGSVLARASDKTLKENIVKVGKSPSGFNIYEWNYLWSPERFRGVIAQEVQKIKPQAVLSNIFGHLLVDYSKLDVNMERI